MNAYTAGMQPQLRRKLARSRGAAKAGQVSEQPGARWLGQHVTETVRFIGTHARKFLTGSLGKVSAMVFS